MRRSYWLIAGALVACTNTDDPDGTVRRTTRVHVSPDAFLGEQVCSTEGGMETFQATLFDVTRGMDRAFVMSSSPVVSCDSTVQFEFVQPGYRYIATIVGFDRSDLTQQKPGSPVVVNKEGKSVSPRWSTVCWGYDDLDPPNLGAGGVGPDEGVPLIGEYGGAPAAIGIEVYSLTTAFLRGCEPLIDTGTPGPTSVSFDLNAARLGLECGDEKGEINRFTITRSSPETATGASPETAMGGAGGSNTAPPAASAKCDEQLVLEDLPGGEYLYFDGFAYEADNTEPSWSTSCQALTIEGVTVNASCSPLKRI